MKTRLLSIFVALVLSACASLAFADAYTVTLNGFNMPAPSPLGSTAKCRAYLGTTALTGTTAAPDRNCGAGAALVLTVPTEATYSVTFTTVNSVGVESAAKSPALSFSVGPTPPPNPGSPPTITGGTCVNNTNGTATCTVIIAP